jgi:hypothetical protein
MIRGSARVVGPAIAAVGHEAGSKARCGLQGMVNEDTYGIDIPTNVSMPMKAVEAIAYFH